jgi:hypothetical protein
MWLMTLSGMKIALSKGPLLLKGTLFVILKVFKSQASDRFTPTY